MKPSVINLIYDGDCPVCQNYSRHLAIRQAAGSLQLMDARDDPPIMKEINARKINIDNGFVLNIGDEFYHGGDAIHALALLSTRALEEEPCAEGSANAVVRCAIIVVGFQPR